MMLSPSLDVKNLFMKVRMVSYYVDKNCCEINLDKIEKSAISSYIRVLDNSYGDIDL
jgi:hypothetical protein